jgi:predicted Zn-dependent peptidase
MLHYLDEYYRPNSLVISIAGNIDEAKIIDATQRLFDDWQPGEHISWVESPPPVDAAPVMIITKETEQVNLCFGTLGIAYLSPDYYTFMLANAILGDGMSSRLFQTIREEQGLAYDIGSYFNTYAETGNFVVSAGVDPSQAEPAIQAILAELTRLCDTPVPDDELARIKAYIKGSLVLGMEGTQQVASWLGGQECLRNRISSVDEMLAQVDAVTPQDIQRVARTCFAPQWRRLAIIGPCESRRAQPLALLLKGGY